MKKILTTISVATLLVIVAAAVFIYSGAYNVGASSPHSATSNWVLATTREASVSRHAKSIVVPDLQSDALRQAGINDYEGMCVACHGAPGKQPGAMGQGLNPPAPDLQQTAQHRTPAELYWVTKHGIKMTGMPAWGVTHDDEALWPVVALLTALPDLDANAYEQLLAHAKGKGHHAVDENNDAAHDADDEDQADEEPEHDHSSDDY